MHTSSIGFPNMFDVSKNKVSVYTDNQSVVSRCKLLMLTEPTELYNSPNFGVGLKQYLWQYNTENVKQIIKDRIISQLNLFEPCVTAENTQFADGLLFSGDPTNPTQTYNQLSFTVGLSTIYGDVAEMKIDNLKEGSEN